MIILGIDPGIATVGYGIIKYEGNKFCTIHYGAITTSSALTLAQRLLIIYNEISELIEDYKPDVMSIEELFFNTNVKTAITVGHGRGVAVLAGANAGIEVHEYTPLQVKQAVVGYGRAEKGQVQQMIKAILCLNCIPKPDDVADALAVAVCHAHSARFNQNSARVLERGCN